MAPHAGQTVSPPSLFHDSPLQMRPRAARSRIPSVRQGDRHGLHLTNLRYTGNTRGAIYGFDQTLNNSGPNRLPHATPIRNLYLSGAWTRPGHGYGGVIGSGLECFAEIMKTW